MISLPFEKQNRKALGSMNILPPQSGIRLRHSPNPAIIPNAQVEQTPKMRAPITLLAPMLVDQMFNELVIKEISLANA